VNEADILSDVEEVLRGSGVKREGVDRKVREIK
jgi:hypothetical protein